MYRLEVFNETLDYISAALIPDDQTIEEDYLTFDSYSVATPPIACSKGNYTHITGEGGNFDGIVADVQNNGNMLDITIRPLQALFDVDVFASPIHDAPSWIVQQIEEQFLNNEDPLQNLPVVIASDVFDSSFPLPVEEETLNILSIMILAMTTFGIVCACSLDFGNKSINVKVQQINGVRTLEAELPNVLEKTITLGDSYSSKNKAVIRRVDENGLYISDSVFFLHPNGEVDQMDSERIAPVFWGLKTIKDSDDWEERAFNAALEMLAPQRYDQEIILRYRMEDRIARPLEMRIGQTVTILFNGTAYPSIFTGRTVERGQVSLTFGCVRTALTKKLLTERRAVK